MNVNRIPTHEVPAHPCQPPASTGVGRGRPPEPWPWRMRVKMQAAGVSYPDVMMRQGIHPEARRPPFTPGWDVVGVVDELGEGVEAVTLGTTVAAMPIVG